MVATQERALPGAAVHDERWYEALADERERARLAHDPACARQRRMFWPVRIVAAVAFAVAVVALVNAVSAFGVGAGLVGIWLLPMVVLGVVLATERLLVRFTK